MALSPIRPYATGRLPMLRARVSVAKRVPLVVRLAAARFPLTHFNA